MKIYEKTTGIRYSENKNMIVWGHTIQSLPRPEMDALKREITALLRNDFGANVAITVTDSQVEISGITTSSYEQRRASAIDHALHSAVEAYEKIISSIVPKFAETAFKSIKLQELRSRLCALYQNSNRGRPLNTLTIDQIQSKVLSFAAAREINLPAYDDVDFLSDFKSKVSRTESAIAFIENVLGVNRYTPRMYSPTPTPTPTPTPIPTPTPTEQTPPIFEIKQMHL
jgi:hypothetical protein